MTDTSRGFNRSIALGMAASIAVGVGALGIWTLQSMSRVGSPLYAAPLPAVMGLAGSFWWRLQRGQGWGLWSITMTETALIAVGFLLLALVFGGLNEVTGLALMMYLALSPMIVVAMYLGGRLGYWMLDRFVGGGE